MQHLSNIQPVGAAFHDVPPDALAADATADGSARKPGGSYNASAKRSSGRGLDSSDEEDDYGDEEED